MKNLNTIQLNKKPRIF